MMIKVSLLAYDYRMPDSGVQKYGLLQLSKIFAIFTKTLVLVFLANLI